MHRTKWDRYSITSSARPRSDCGIVRPSALAVLEGPSPSALKLKHPRRVYARFAPL